MNFNRVYDKLSSVRSIRTREQFVDLLERTWVGISTDYCMEVLKRRRSVENINIDEIARVELSPDEVRCAVYCHMNRWVGTNEQHLLDEWFDLSIEEQNDLLIRAFSDGRVYGV